MPAYMGQFLEHFTRLGSLPLGSSLLPVFAVAEEILGCRVPLHRKDKHVLLLLPLDVDKNVASLRNSTSFKFR